MNDFKEWGMIKGVYSVCRREEDKEKKAKIKTFNSTNFCIIIIKWIVLKYYLKIRFMYVNIILLSSLKSYLKEPKE